MLGTNEDALAFIQEFSTRRFNRNTGKKAATATATSSSSPQQKPQQPQQKQQQQNELFPTLPADQYHNETEWPANINVYMKKDTQGDYYSGGGAKKNNKSKFNSTTTESKKKKKNEMTLEAALKELHIKASTEENGERRPCQCQATKHQLLTIAPNCLNCGKIICTVEGTGPCTFCGTPVLSKEQQVALIAEAKRKRTEEKQRINAQQQSSKKRSKASVTQSVGYAAKVSGRIIPQNAYEEPTFTHDQEEQNRQHAEAHKEKLLERRVMTIDVQSRQVVLDKADSSSDEESEPEDLPAANRSQKDMQQHKENDGSARTYANNPLLKGLEAPKFVGKQGPLKGGRNRRKERVQYDDIDIFDDYQYASSIADDRDIALEPACG
ncbi:putative zinc finger motif, C2HC5-type-domain-containing protein [Zychaea mexicana]|uniref:putative zinc finger motif, C2HC5-type-domain-containing protein n=1 Tax=Zychaea mexicana TaxID=64656 RepID=UPI0022FE34D2|nr:putative zinc finger motif, C2HC5-type-domain-containing protein [Zychaea mexicana]KAI9484307.1 putative zinc finger motif, C2HC5-type-domain-containing protein [Zychaea mexicana]